MVIGVLRTMQIEKKNDEPINLDEGKARVCVSV